ncbi:transmembrane protein 236-like [Coregonus clupeaformis]|uniref:transmembrane protein 236-like n=1 Tax=Coregonus clupeaformis TaxID=59861 RepID=UPI001BE070A0|nr:transmembrane protein 236-like [Coregonus clupeaformis]
MASGRTLKFALCEVLQFAGLCVPLFIVMQRFALIVALVKSVAQPPGDASTAYWLIVASSIAYVTSTALLVWVPMKYMVFMNNTFLVGRKKWRPVALVYLILSTLPCFAFLIASSEVQINNSIRQDTFAELPVSLVLFSLICIDIVERIRHCRLTGHANELDRDAEIPSTVLTNVTPVTPINPENPAAPVTPAVPGQPTQPGQPGRPNGQDQNQNEAGSRPEANGTLQGMPGNQMQGRQFSISGLSSRSARSASMSADRDVSPYAYTGPLRFLCASDARAEVFVDSFLFWMDTVEMVRVAGHPAVYYSGWVFPIYIFSYLSCLRLMVMPHSPLLSSLGVALQDLPFLFVRIGLIAFFGFVTPLLYLMKNLLVCLAFIYFNFMTKLKVFNTKRMF